MLWAVLGPVYRYSDTWQLVINTATTIITFLMVFLIQKTQNRDAKAAPALSAHSRRGARHRPCLLGPEGRTTYRDNPRSLLDSPRDSSAGGAWPILTENNRSAAHVTVGEYFTHRLPERHEGPGPLNIRTLRSLRHHVLIYAGLTPFVAIALFPVFWMAITAFKQDIDLYRVGQFPFWFYHGPTLDHFRLLITRTYFVPQLVNTLLLSACVVVITVMTAVPAGYALARMQLPGAGNLGIVIFCTYLVPGVLLFIPLARVVGTLGLFDSWWALVVVYPTFTIPFCTWKMLAYFKTVPREVEEAAWVDGCGLVGGLVRVVVPLSRQGVIITSIFAFSLSMQEFLYAVVYVAPRSEKVVTVGLVTNLIRGDIYYWGSLMAGGLIIGLPIAIVYGLVLENFVQGLSGGST